MPVATFRRKSTIVQAIQLQEDNLEEVSAFTGTQATLDTTEALHERAVVRVGGRKYATGVWLFKEAHEMPEGYKWQSYSNELFKLVFVPCDIVSAASDAIDDAVSATSAVANNATRGVTIDEQISNQAYGCVMSDEWDSPPVMNKLPAYSSAALEVSIALGLVAVTGPLVNGTRAYRILTPLGLAFRSKCLAERTARVDRSGIPVDPRLSPDASTRLRR